MSENVRVERRDRVAEITIDRPKANAIDQRTSQALGTAFAEFRDDAGLSVAIITGGGERFFSAGWDLKAAAAGDESADQAYGPGGFGGLTELFNLNKPVIAAVNGMAAGGGFEIALAADLIVAAEHVEVWLPEAGIGIMPDAGGVIRLPRRMPRALATEMMFTARRLGAEEGLRHGVFNQVVPGDRLMDEARDLAARISRSAPLSLQAIKEVMRETEGMTVESAYRLMAEGNLPAYRRMQMSEDAKEGPLAFAQKREPRWQGK